MNFIHSVAFIYTFEKVCFVKDIEINALNILE